MDKFAALTGRAYHLFDYVGAADAERVVVLMGSGTDTAQETVESLVGRGEKVGVIRVHLYRPFSADFFAKALPATVKSIAVLDRTKEPGSVGEPLYMDVVAAVAEAKSKGTAPFAALPKVIGGRYGLGSKEFTPGMVKAVFDELAKPAPKNHFTIGINDDVSHTSLDYDPHFSAESESTVRCIFWGLGSDGTVGANKNSIKIIGEETDNFAQGYFAYDSKKSGSLTTSYLRFGPQPIRAPSLILQANFLACHQFSFLERYNVLEALKPGGVFLLNSIYSPEEVWDNLPRETQAAILEKKLRFYVIDAYKVAQDTGMGGRINTIMQTCFFAISGILPREQAIEEIKKAIKKTYGKRGEAVVKKNFEAVDATLAHLHEVPLAGRKANSKITRREAVPAAAPDFVKKVLGPMIAGEGDSLPVSAMPLDGTYPTGTTQWEKRNITLEIPVWEPELCIQCGKCAMVCPHAVIRQKVYAPAALAKAPSSFKSMDAKFKEFPGTKYTIQVSPEDCTGCGLCIEACPAKDKTQVSRKAINMADQPPLREQENANWAFFLGLPEADRAAFQPNTIKNSQLLQPLFEFSGACAGCGETPYIKLATQLFGDRMVIANATGCSSIYGGNLPTTPYTFNREGRGPAWSNSLFEDNAEFGLGMRLTLDKQIEYARELLPQLAGVIGEQLVKELLEADQSNELGIRAQRERMTQLRKKLQGSTDAESQGPALAGRRAGQEKRLDHRRRRLGLRHRLRRARPRARLRPQRQHAGARHRGVFQHRRAGIEIHAARGRGQIRLARQSRRQEGPRPDGDVVRLRVRGARGVRRQRPAHIESLPRGGSLRRPVADHRLQPLHQPGARHAQGARSAAAGGAIRLLAAPALQPGAGGGGQESAGDRFEGSDRSARPIRLQ